jgi:hypothetical protein
MSQPAEPLPTGPGPAAAPGPPADYRSDPYFTWPERVPWSELEPDFTMAWGRADPANPQPEHLEIFGQNGSGKTRLMLHMLQARMIRRETPAVIVCTKRADDVFTGLGWPVIDRPEDLNKHPNAIFWPQTGAMGTARKDFHDRKIRDLLAKLWVPDSNRIVAFDEVGYLEGLSGETRAMVQQYWREGRSIGITVVGMKQRPQGAQRDMHSETWWTAAFKPKDRGDLERWAELFGARRDWMPVFDTLDADRYEFVLRHSRSGEAYISWVDVPLQQVKPPKQVPAWLGRRKPRNP